MQLRRRELSSAYPRVVALPTAGPNLPRPSTPSISEAAASTEVDQKALPLLTNEFNTMDALTDKYLRIAASRDYLAPNALSSDPMEQKLLMCWQSLASTASSNQVVDDGSCQ